MCNMVVMVTPGPGVEALAKGDPLTLYMRSLPVSNVTHVALFPDTGVSGRDEYRILLGPGGNPNDRFTVFFPPLKEDNKLQYEPNSSIKGRFDMEMLAFPPPDVSDLEFRVEVIIEIDYENDGTFDDTLSFTVIGTADNDDKREPTRYNGTIEADPKDYGSMKGGRLRITFQRKDSINTPVWLYTGYVGGQTCFTLPFSKYTYVPADDDGDTNLFPLLIIGGIIVMGIAAYLIYDRSQKESKNSELTTQERGRKGSDRKRTDR